MAQLAFIFSSIALLGGFIALTEYETQRGARLFSRKRAQLDERVAQLEFILRHVDFGAFIRDEMRHILSKLGHDIAHLSLQIVRAVERLLTRLVMRLRSHREIERAPRESQREFVKTLSDFKSGLKTTHPDISDIS